MDNNTKTLKRKEITSSIDDTTTQRCKTHMKSDKISKSAHTCE